MLIVFEGIDGSGKGEQVRMLSSFLLQHNVPFCLHKYPTKRAKQAFAHLEERKSVAATELVRVFLDDIMAEQGKLRADIGGGKVVICDRYLHSTLAYQGAQGSFGKLQAKLGALGALVPDLVIVLDLDPALGAGRKAGQKAPDRHEKDAAFLRRVRKGYLKMASQGFLAYKYAIVDASRRREEVFSDVVSQVEPVVIRKLESIGGKKGR